MERAQDQTSFDSVFGSGRGRIQIGTLTAAVPSQAAKLEAARLSSQLQARDFAETLQILAAYRTHIQTAPLLSRLAKNFAMQAMDAGSSATAVSKAQYLLSTTMIRSSTVAQHIVNDRKGQLLHIWQDNDVHASNALDEKGPSPNRSPLTGFAYGFTCCKMEINSEDFELATKGNWLRAHHDYPLIDDEAQDEDPRCVRCMDYAYRESECTEGYPGFLLSEQEDQTLLESVGTQAPAVLVQCLENVPSLWNVQDALEEVYGKAFLDVLSSKMSEASPQKIVSLLEDNAISVLNVARSSNKKINAALSQEQWKQLLLEHTDKYVLGEESGYSFGKTLSQLIVTALK